MPNLTKPTTSGIMHKGSLLKEIIDSLLANMNVENPEGIAGALALVSSKVEGIESNKVPEITDNISKIQTSVDKLEQGIANISSKLEGGISARKTVALRQLATGLSLSSGRETTLSEDIRGKVLFVKTQNQPTYLQVAHMPDTDAKSYTATYGGWLAFELKNNGTTFHVIQDSASVVTDIYIQDETIIISFNKDSA